MRKIFFWTVNILFIAGINAQTTQVENISPKKTDMLYDSLFYLNGNVEVVRIIRNQSDAIDCNYIGEDMLSTINKSLLHKIVFRSGRIEICNNQTKEILTDKIWLINGNVIEGKVTKITENEIEYTYPNDNLINSIFKGTIEKIEFADGRVESFSNLLNVKEIFMDSQWEDVVVTYDFEDTRGLERVAELAESSPWRGWFAGKGYNSTVKELKQKAAELRCGLVYINANLIQGQVEYGVNLRATAYRIPQGKQVSEEELKAKFIEEFYDGSIKQYSEEAQEKKVDVFEEKIRQDFDTATNKEDFESADSEYNVLKEFLSTYFFTPMWAKRTINRIERSKKNAKKRLNL